MRQVNVYEAKTQLSKLIDAAAAGEEIVIARAGRPVARLVAVEAEKRARRPGSHRGQVWIAPDFDAPLPEFEEAFYQGDASEPSS